MPSSTIFEEPFWLDAVAPGSWSESVVRDATGNVRARMTFRTSRRYGLRVIRNALLSPYVGPSVAHDAQRRPERKLAYELAIAGQLLAALPPHELAVLQLAPAFAGWLAFRWNGFRLLPMTTHTLDLTPSVDELWDRVTPDLRREIRYASEQVEVSDELDPERLAALVARRLDTKQVTHHLGADLLTRIAVALKAHECHIWTVFARAPDGTVRGGALFAGDSRCIFYLAGAVEPGTRGSLGGLLLWEGIRRAREHASLFDFEGSQIPALERLFREVGGKQQILIRAVRFSGRLAMLERVLRRPWLG